MYLWFLFHEIIFQLSSAGVGRTGAIIALDYLQEQAAAESQVDFYQCVVKMRERRPKMIQTEVQYLYFKARTKLACKRSKIWLAFTWY